MPSPALGKYVRVSPPFQHQAVRPPAPTTCSAGQIIQQTAAIGKKGPHTNGCRPCCRTRSRGWAIPFGAASQQQQNRQSARSPPHPHFGSPSVAAISKPATTILSRRRPSRIPSILDPIYRTAPAASVNTISRLPFRRPKPVVASKRLRQPPSPCLNTRLGTSATRRRSRRTSSRWPTLSCVGSPSSTTDCARTSRENAFP